MADWTVAAAEQKAAGFYATLTAAPVLGVAITLSPIDPIKALYWTAVINGVVAVPVMTVMMLMTAQPRMMGKFDNIRLVARARLGVHGRWPHASSEWSSARSLSLGPTSRSAFSAREDAAASRLQARGALTRARDGIF